MKHATTAEPLAYRFGAWGPVYLLEADSLALGVVALRPGDEVENHRHDRCDETFVILEGACTLWVDRVTRVTMRAGEVYSCAPGEEHHLVNDTASTCRLVFVKTPPSPGDTVALPWRP
jgi:quercetin dioxygenase-like cupin family protein